MLALYGHPFSSYTWKALIALYDTEIPFEFRVVDPEHPRHQEIVKSASPLGKFPVLDDDGALIFEATSIIEHLSDRFDNAAALIPSERAAAISLRMMDRVFDNYVMGVMQIVVDEYIRDAENPDATRIGEAREKLIRVYGWLESWLDRYDRPERISLIECAAAPSLFYADWVHPIPEDCSRLKQWRAHLLSLPAVKRCVDDARPYRGWFPPGAPDRD
ncbi:glutathione S-transferase family protein [Marinicaulis aureus]|uniref:Glutathione S-transferase family protein n=1 Tax=Hyphococcus aureus TaxID=2666033 RepID=A0ABW1KW82_9PROT